MTWQLQLIVEQGVQWFISDGGTHAVFAGLYLWAATGQAARWCALFGGGVHLLLMFA